RPRRGLSRRRSRAAASPRSRRRSRAECDAGVPAFQHLGKSLPFGPRDDLRETALDWRWALVIVAACATVASRPAAQSVEEFYRGRTITMIVSTGVGNGFDTNARQVARHLGRHIPGHPTVVVKNMPGAGHVLAANHMAIDAPRDGTTIALIMPSIITHQLLDGRGVRYDVAKFQWLGP